MRISTLNAFNTGIDELQRRQQDLANARRNWQIFTTGKRVNQASDDPVAAAEAERALATQARATAMQRAVNASQNAMTQTESALGNAGDLLQQARELVVQAATEATPMPTARALPISCFRSGSNCSGSRTSRTARATTSSAGRAPHNLHSSMRRVG